MGDKHVAAVWGDGFGDGKTGRCRLQIIAPNTDPCGKGEDTLILRSARQEALCDIIGFVNLVRIEQDMAKPDLRVEIIGVLRNHLAIERGRRKTVALGPCLCCKVQGSCDQLIGRCNG